VSRGRSRGAVEAETRLMNTDVPLLRDVGAAFSGWTQAAGELTAGASPAGGSGRAGTARPGPGPATASFELGRAGGAR
jgi:hypothetical protein